MLIHILSKNYNFEIKNKFMIKRKLYNTTQALLAITLSLLVGSCNKEVENNNEKLNIEDTNVFINNDSQDLSKRITYYNEPINNENKDVAADDIWFYVAEVASPIFNGNVLSATYIAIVDDKAYVSYHKAGSVYAGGVEVIDLANPAAPMIISQELFEGVDINALEVDYNGNNTERNLWLAGSSFKKGAILRQVSLFDGLLSQEITDVNLSNSLNGDVITASANGIVQSADYIYVTSGQSYGGTFQLLTDDLSVIANEAYTHAKFPAVNGKQVGAKQVSLVTGDNSKLYVYDVGEDRTATVFDIESIFHQNVDNQYIGKSVLCMEEDEDIAYVSSGQKGMIAYDINTGDQVYTTPAEMLIKGNTNGLAIDGGYIYLANGSDGLYIAKFPDGGAGEIIPVQIWDMDEDHASANFVQANENWVFVAKGGGGFKILRKFK